ncbi:Histone-lysine N-methyltransferase ATXR3 [Zea mays]|uniref:Histone-lysine N-methyltransferase ATXR3 n=1 Tax=Zea mays TaxID=4577 RepID=A0A1D6QTZ1_MAIZE|nr:Histone-lysine N-methyltransferase ATXR3 [Zea mays]
MALDRSITLLSDDAVVFLSGATYNTKKGGDDTGSSKPKGGGSFVPRHLRPGDTSSLLLGTTLATEGHILLLCCVNHVCHFRSCPMSWIRNPHKFRQVIDASIVYDPWTRESQGFGFVTMPCVKEAYRYIKYLNRFVMQDQVITAEKPLGLNFFDNLLSDIMPADLELSPTDKHIFIEELLLNALNKQVRSAEDSGGRRTLKMCLGMLKFMRNRSDQNFVAYRKVYPSWRWYEKQDGIEHIQSNSEDQAPEFYNIMLERSKGDRYGYDLVFVDAMHKANYASRICHSCNPNCEAK